MCGWMGGSVGQWVGSGQMTKNLINLDLINIIQLWLNIYDLWRHPTYMWVVGWICGVRSNHERLCYVHNTDTFNAMWKGLKDYVMCTI